MKGFVWGGLELHCIVVRLIFPNAAVIRSPTKSVVSVTVRRRTHILPMQSNQETAAMLEQDRSSTDGQQGLRSWSFAGLVAMQFLTVVNDNVFRWLVVGIGKKYVDREQGTVCVDCRNVQFRAALPAAGGPSGYLADRFSKRAVIVRCKFAEIVLMLGAILAIWLGNIYLIFVVLALLGAQSCLFSPARLGTIRRCCAPMRFPRRPV